MSGLRPLYPSLLVKRTAYSDRPRPSNMERMGITSEQRQSFEGIALDIFTDMTNAGCSLQETLAAIYVSGLVHATEIKGRK